MKLAIVGSGMIVGDALVAFHALADRIELTDLYVRPHSLEKGEKLAAENGIGQVWTDFDRMLEGAQAQVYYIALANSAHYAYTKRALLAGKHVICEKPLTTTAAQARELADIAREKGVFLLEAVTVCHAKVYDHLKAALESIGRIRLVQSNYSQYSSRYDRYLAGDVAPAFNPELGGGCLYDLNIYNLNFAVSLFGEPQSVTYAANRGFNGVDTSGTVVADYGSFNAVLSAAKDSDSPCFTIVQGEKGYLEVLGKPNLMQAGRVCIRGQESEEYRPEPDANRMVQEFVDFERIVREGDAAEAERLLQISLQVMEVAQRARESAGIVYPADQA